MRSVFLYRFSIAAPQIRAAMNCIISKIVCAQILRMALCKMHKLFLRRRKSALSVYRAREVEPVGQVDPPDLLSPPRYQCTIPAERRQSGHVEADIPATRRTTMRVSGILFLCQFFVHFEQFGVRSAHILKITDSIRAIIFDESAFDVPVKLIQSFSLHI